MWHFILSIFNLILSFPRDLRIDFKTFRSHFFYFYFVFFCFSFILCFPFFSFVSSKKKWKEKNINKKLFFKQTEIMNKIFAKIKETLLSHFKEIWFVFFSALGSYVVVVLVLVWDKDGNNSDYVKEVQTLEPFYFHFFLF